jgi:hypothetical protein
VLPGHSAAPQLNALYFVAVSQRMEDFADEAGTAA